MFGRGGHHHHHQGHHHNHFSDRGDFDSDDFSSRHAGGRGGGSSFRHSHHSHGLGHYNGLPVPYFTSPIAMQSFEFRQAQYAYRARELGHYPLYNEEDVHMEKQQKRIDAARRKPGARRKRTMDFQVGSYEPPHWESEVSAWRREADLAARKAACEGRIDPDSKLAFLEYEMDHMRRHRRLESDFDW